MPKSMSPTSVAVFAAFCLTLANAPGTPACAPDDSAQIAELLAAPHRGADRRARDIYRHPLETLAFFGLCKSMSVVEVWPGSGWHAEILAPLLTAGRGVYYAAGFNFGSQRIRKYQREMQRELEATARQQAANYERMVFTVFDPPRHLAIAPKASADLVLSFRNLHNWLGQGYLNAAFRAFYLALKPGGILGLVEHRAKPNTSLQEQLKTGYLDEEMVIDMASQAGFILLARSEINANPKDTHNHPGGVWALPPSLRWGDLQRDKYLAIGESDRMTLKFIKPSTAGDEMRSLQGEKPPP
jgi:predicted methyltransferase